MNTIDLFGQVWSRDVTPLYEIKQDNNGDGVADLTGDTVTVSGIANIATGQLHEIYMQIFIQNDSTGLSLFTESFDRSVSTGDSINVTGVVQQYYGLTEIQVKGYKILKRVPLPRPIGLDEVIKNPHRYEGMLIKGSGMVIGKGTRFNGKYLKISPVDDTNQSIMVYVSNFHRQFQDFNFGPLSIGDKIHVTGILSQYDPDFPVKSTFKIFLRTPDDLVILGIAQSTLIWLGIIGIIISILIIGWIVSLKSRVNTKTSQFRKSLNEKELLLKEIHHRVKNNLAIISGLIELQLNSSLNIETQKVLRDSQARIQSMALVHDKLYRTNTVTDIAMEAYVRELVEALKSTFATSNSEVELKFELDDIQLDIDRAIPCGLLINELVVNAFKHAFGEDQKGRLEIKLLKKGSEIELLVADNGPGIPETVETKKDSLGMMLIDTFTGQLEATKEVKNENGAKFIFTFPAEPPVE